MRTMSEPLADTAIIQQSQCNPEAFAQIFDRYHRDVHAFVARRAGREAADDVLSEVFLAAFAQRASYDLDMASARPWLFGIANNLVKRRWRSMASQQRLATRLAALPASSNYPENGLAAGVDAEREWEQVRVALGRLPKEEQEALLLYAWEELTYSEIAKLVGVPVGTIRSRIHRARTQLRVLVAGVSKGDSL